jgi:hypothetical protein
MPGKLLSVAITLLFAQGLICARPVSAAGNPEKEAKLTRKVKDAVARLGTGKDARVAVRLKDKTRLAGYVSAADEGSFSITDAKTGEASVVAYSNVTQMKGHNLSTGGKIAIGLGIAAAVLLILLIFENYG